VRDGRTQFGPLYSYTVIYGIVYIVEKENKHSYSYSYSNGEKA
jgi:hypothetical protein